MHRVIKYEFNKNVGPHYSTMLYLCWRDEMRRDVVRDTTETRTRGKHASHSRYELTCMRSATVIHMPGAAYDKL